MDAIWVLRPRSTSHGLYWSNEQGLSRAYDKAPLIDGMRSVFLEESTKKIIELDLVMDDGSFATDVTAVTDVLLWGLAAVFSSRATDCLVGLGCNTNDFVQCQIRQLPTLKFYIFLPIAAFGRIDIEQSEFLLTVPGTPPKFGMPKALSLIDVTDPPPLFLLSQADPCVLVTDYMASDHLRSAWLDNKFTGGEFRPLTAIRTTILD
jgi:hypothetical protein